MSGAVNLLKAAAVWKVVDNGSKSAAGIKRLGEINKESLDAKHRQNEISEEIASLTKENIRVNRQRNQIEMQKLNTLEARNDIARYDAELSCISLELEQRKEEKRDLRLSIEYSQKEVLERQRDIIFNIKKDLERMEKPWESKVELFIQLLNHRESLKVFDISTELASSFEDKEFIFSASKEVEKKLKTLSSQLNDEETEDVIKIINIFKVNEEKLIIEAEFDVEPINKEIENLETKRKNNLRTQDRQNIKLLDLEEQLRLHELKQPRDPSDDLVDNGSKSAAGIKRLGDIVSN